MKKYFGVSDRCIGEDSKKLHCSGESLSLVFLFTILVFVLVFDIPAQGVEASTILAPGTHIVETIGANSSLCYTIPITENLQNEQLAYRFTLVVNKLPEQDPRSTLELFLNKDQSTYFPTKKEHGYVSESADPWMFSFDSYYNGYSSDIWTACVYSSYFPISYDIQAISTVIAPQIGPGEPVSVAVEPGRLAFFVINCSLISEDVDRLFNITLGDNDASSMMIYANIWRFAQFSGSGKDDREYHGYRSIFIPFPRKDELYYVILENKGSSAYNGTLSVMTCTIPTRIVSLNTTYTVDLFSALEITELSVSVLSGQYTNLELKMIVSNGDLDVYIGINYVPTRDNYDYHDISYDRQFKTSILVDNSTVVYLLWSAKYWSTGAFTATTQPFRPQIASNKIPVTFPASAADIQYIAFDIPTQLGGPDFSLLVESRSFNGRSASLYLSFGKIPNHYDYLMESGYKRTPDNSIYRPETKAGRWYVMADLQDSQTSLTIKFSVLPQVITELRGTGVFNYTGGKTQPECFKYTVTESIDYLTVSDNRKGSYIQYQWMAMPINKAYVAYHGYNHPLLITIPNPNGTWYFKPSADKSPYDITVIGAKVTSLNLDCNDVTDSGQLGQWKYYSLKVDQLKFLDIEITTAVVSGLDLYLLSENLPERFTSEYNVSGMGKNKIRFSLPPNHNGTFFLGLSMTATTSFTISICPKEPNFLLMDIGVAYNQTLDVTDNYYYIDVVDPNVEAFVFSVDKPAELALFLSQGFLPEPTRSRALARTDKGTFHATIYSLGRYYLVVHKAKFLDKKLTYSVRCTQKNKDQIAPPLESGKPFIVKSYDSKDPKFFSISVGNTSVPVVVTATFLKRDFSSPTMYAAHGKLPSTTNYQYRARSSNRGTFIAFKPFPGTYYFMIPGQYPSQHEKYVTISVLATFEANRVPIPLSNGIQHTFQASLSAWNDFSIYVDSGSVFMIQYPQASTHSDVVVYVRFESLATTQEYTKKSSPGSSVMYIADPDYGVYYISILSSNQSLSSFSFAITAFVGGTCGDKVECLCPSDRDDCSQIISGLDDGALYSGFVEHNSWVHYALTVDHGADLLVNFQPSFESGDRVYCYIRFGEVPTNTSYDYVVTVDSIQRSLTLMDLPSGVTYISVYGGDVNQYAEYTISASLLDYELCPNHCSGHGTCFSLACSCDSSWSGDDCSVYQNQIPSEISFETMGHLRTGFYNYFTVVGSDGAPSSLDLHVRVQLTGPLLLGAVELYVKAGTDLPSTKSFDLTSTNGTTDLVIVSKMTRGKLIQLAVYCPSAPIDYQIIVFPVEVPSHSVVLSVFVVLLVLIVLVAGVYFLKWNKGSIVPVIKRITSLGSGSNSDSSSNQPSSWEMRLTGLLELGDERPITRQSQEDAIELALIRTIEGAEGKERDEEDHFGLFTTTITNANINTER